jgi:hypothetical protein
VQLFCGVVAAIAFLATTVWSAPYRTRATNFLAMCANLALVLNLLCSLGVEFNTRYEGAGRQAISPEFVSVVLFVTLASMLGLTLLLPCIELLRQQCQQRQKQQSSSEGGSALGTHLLLQGDEQPVNAHCARS